MSAQAISDASHPARAAGLRYSNLNGPGICRRKAGKGFTYLGPEGTRIKDTETLERIRKLVIPPAWRSVWIAPDERGHIQAVGYDDRGRLQYKYHPKFREVREQAKFEHMLEFASALPTLRQRLAKDMAKPGVVREKVLATVVHLLETTLIRIGNPSYARENKSYGLTTLLDRHVRIEGSELRFHFSGKSGKTWNLSVRDRRIARIVKACQDVPGQHLFQYYDANGERQQVTSSDVNDYLREIAGGDITAKDFRTWTGTVLAALALHEFEAGDTKAAAKRNVTRAIERVALRLGNSPTICRKCYVHPEILDSYLDGQLMLEIRDEIDRELSQPIDRLSPGEAAVLAFLRARLSRDLRKAA